MAVRIDGGVMVPRSQRDSDPNQTQTSREPKHLVTGSPLRRAKAFLGTVPLVIVSSLAMSIGLAGPAQASTTPKRLDRVKANDLAAQTPRALLHPRSAEPVPQTYVVVEGDSISGIAGRFGLATASVLALNGLSWKSLIFPGQTLVLTDGTVPVAVVTPQAPEAITRHTVVAGDTISGIAEAHGLSTDTVLAANGLDRSSVIYPGESIALPDAATAPPPQDVTPLSAEMRQNAQAIASVARSQGVSDYGIVIALAAAMQESGLRNVRYGDRDSLGLFQQRPSTGWGTPDQIMDPVFASHSFFGGPSNPHPGLTKGLLDIPGWESMTVSQAAQAVQLSAYPDTYGAWEASARVWLTQLT
jgi:N-acetylmuramoyl-L-alanine amidase